MLVRCVWGVIRAWVRVLGRGVATVAAWRQEHGTRAPTERAAAEQSILDAGGTILTLTPEQRTAWVETMMPVWAQFVEDVGQENIDAAQAINDSL